MESKYVHPEFNKESFNCPHCKILTHHFWAEMYWYPETPQKPHKTMTLVPGFRVSQCYTCKEYSIWIFRYNINEELEIAEMVYPANLSYFPEPNEDLSKEITMDYLEAGKILKESPRGTAALLRLCVQKLVDSLEPGSGNLNNKIKILVKKGLDTEIQEALDLTRVIGNEAVHPGQLDLKDDMETARLLFETINLITEKLISLPKRIKKAYDKLPTNKLEEIKKRDK